MAKPNEPTLVVEEEQPQMPGAVLSTPGAGEEEKPAPTEETTPETPPVESKEAPKERVYSKEEWSKRESALTKQVEEAKRQAQDVATKAEQKAQEAIAQYQKQQDDAYIAKVEAEGGDIRAAQAQLTKEQGIREREADLNKREASFQVESLKAFEIAKRNDAERLAREYGLTDIEPLMTAGTPTEMELIASKAALEAAKTGAKPPVKTDSNISNTKGADWSKLSPTEKVLEGIKDMEF